MAATTPPPPDDPARRPDLEPSGLDHVRAAGGAASADAPKPSVAEAKRRLRAIAEREASDDAARVVRVTVGGAVTLGVVGLGALALTVKLVPKVLLWSTRGLGRRALRAASRPFRG